MLHTWYWSTSMVVRSSKRSKWMGCQRELSIWFFGSSAQQLRQCILTALCIAILRLSCYYSARKHSTHEVRRSENLRLRVRNSVWVKEYPLWHILIHGTRDDTKYDLWTWGRYMGIRNSTIRNDWGRGTVQGDYLLLSSYWNEEKLILFWQILIRISGPNKKNSKSEPSQSTFSQVNFSTSLFYPNAEG
jgi:hypothetical protein